MVIDNLNSSSTDDSLSANQGKVLNNKILVANAQITSLGNRVTALENSGGSGGATNSYTKIWT